MKEFDKIIGYEPVKKELERISDILNNSEKYKKFGVKPSQGLLLYGEPGVGKSLIADCFIKAVKRKCYLCRKTKADGDFVDEITKTFEEAKLNQPAIILLDDMDKFANEDKNRRDAEEYVAIQSGIDNIKDFDVFVVATANEIDKLPYSLRRSGRFSKQIEIAPPEGKDAEDIIRFYLSKKKNVGEVNITEIARLLNTKTCADLEVIVNEAGIYAAFEGKEKIEQCDLIRACLRVLYDAPEASELVFSNVDDKNKMTAYHEAGHAVVAEILEPESVTMVSIAKYTGDAAGLTLTYQTNEYFHSIDYMKNRVKVCLAGKAVTELLFGKIDVGATNDLQRAVKIASRFDNDYCGSGFDSRVGYEDFSDSQMERHNQKVARELEESYMAVKEILTKNREFLDKIANLLLQKTTIMMSEIQEVKKTCKIVR